MRRMERDLPAGGVLAWRTIRNASADGALAWRTIRNASEKALFVVRIVWDRARLSRNDSLGFDWLRFFVLDFENAEYADNRQFCDLVFYPRKAGATRQNQNRVRKSSTMRARILYYCPIRPLHAGEREDAASLVAGLDVGLHVVANAGVPLGGGGRYRVCAPDSACRSCVRGVPFDARHSAAGVDPRSARLRGDRGYDD